MVPSLTANCNCTISNLTVGSLRSASATVDWIFCWNNSAQSANRVKVEGQGASKQFKEGGKTHEPKSSTTTTTPEIPKILKICRKFLKKKVFFEALISYRYHIVSRKKPYYRIDIVSSQKKAYRSLLNQASLFLPLCRRNHLLRNSPFSVNL